MTDAPGKNFIDLTANMNYGTAVVNFTNSNPFTALGRSLAGNSVALGAGPTTLNGAGVPVPSLSTTEVHP